MSGIDFVKLTIVRVMNFYICFKYRVILSIKSDKLWYDEFTEYYCLS